MFGTHSKYDRPTLEMRIARENNVDYSEVISDLSEVSSEIEKYIREDEEKRRKAANSYISHTRVVSCPVCENNDPTEFINKPREGDIICAKCGVVVAANTLYEGEYTRNFEGEEDTSQVGAAYNPLLSGAANLETPLVAVSSKKQKIAQQRQRNIEQNLSNAFNDNKDTRIEYKDMKKTRALSTMQRIGNSLGLEDAVVDLAHRYFCYCRDAKEKLNRENTCIVQCLVLALQRMRAQDADVIKSNPSEHLQTFTCELCGLDFYTKRDLKFHSCEKKTQTKQEKPSLAQQSMKRSRLLAKLSKNKEELFDERELLEKKPRKK